MMQYQLFLIPTFFIPILPINTHTPKNNSDVIVTYAGHAEAEFDRMKLIPSKPDTETTKKPEQNKDFHFKEESNPDVLFIPKEKPSTATRRPYSRVNDDEYLTDDGGRNDGGTRIDDLTGDKKTVGDVISGKGADVDTEAPSSDILFISGKNNENSDNPDKVVRNEQKHTDYFEPNDKKDSTVVSEKPLDCTNLNCGSTVMSLCGGKVDHGAWKYRLFMNECYFRRVNCDFAYDVNRYKKVPLEKCEKIGGHYRRHHSDYEYEPRAPPRLPRPEPLPVVNSRRSDSRRALFMNIDGRACAHTCPDFCTEDYDPQCALSGQGERRVFINHCQLDLNSCSMGLVWRQRPLAECVGGKRADMQQNRAFVNWMQRVGIVDRKGRLVLE